MRVLDVLVIYLSIGAPVAMTFLLRNRRKPSIRLWLMTVATLFLWLPILMIRGTVRHFDKKKQSSFAAREPGSEALDRQLKDISEIIRRNGAGSSVNEVVERYTALTNLTNSPDFARETVSRSEIFSIAGNRNESTGSACLARKNEQKLVRHQQKASEDLLRLAAEFTTGSGNSAGLRQKLLDLAEMLGDNYTAEQIKDLAKSQVETVKIHKSVSIRI